MTRRCLTAAALSAILALPALATWPPQGTPPGPPPGPSIHQTDSAAHATPGPEPLYPRLYTVQPAGQDRALPAPSALSRTVYGFAPTWVVSDLSHVRWDLVSHACYFSVGLNADGSLTNNSGSYAWPSGAYVQALLNTAHANGVKVPLAATNFTASQIATLLSSATYRQTAIDNLVSLVQSGGGDGVNIDLEGVPAAQNANLVTFMTDLAAAFHSAIPGSHVSIDTPAVDWSSAFNYGALAQACDALFIMGYDYHWSSASTAGPCAPLTGGGVWGTYTVTWTVNDYLTDAGAYRDKILLGLPYYGHDWPTATTSVPSNTTATGSTRTYDAARPEAAAYGRLWDAASQTPYYTYTSGTPHQGWYDDAESLGLKWDLVNSQDLGGTGMWALNYDKSDEELWDALEARFASPGAVAGAKIGIDPGHGGTDSGAVGPTGLEEADLNLATSLLLRDALVDQGAACYLTRSTDTTVSLTARTDYFNSIPVDRAESCHYNASGTASANYTGVHIYDDGSGTCPASATSKDMASKTALRLDAALAIGVVSTNCGIYGVHGDNFHMVRETAMPSMLTEASFISNPTEESLLYTSARRCTIAGAIAKGIEDHYGGPAAEPPCAGGGAGTCANPIPIASFPYSDSNTTSGKSSVLNGYSCPPGSGSEAGPEVVYGVTLSAAGTLAVSVSDGTGVDIDPHLLSSCSASACLARNDTAFSLHLLPGEYTLVCDTWTSAGGTPYPGAYTLSVTFSPDDTTGPAAVEDLVWNAAAQQWEWTAVTLDQLGGPETMGHYELWRSQSASAGSALVTDDLSTPAAPDAATPGEGLCWYYQVKGVDAAGNREDAVTQAIVDNPQAVFAGTWATGSSSPDRYGDDYRYVSVGGTGSKTATYTFTPESTGNYTVALYYPEGTNRSSASRFTVSHAGGSTLYTVNQQTGGGAWRDLGTHWLSAGTASTVTLDDAEPAGSFVVIADAVRWTKAP